MSLLNYSHTLVAGTPENVNDVQDMFNDVRTLVNGNLDATNLASGAKPADLMAVYRNLAEHEFTFGGSNPAGTYWASMGGSGFESNSAANDSPALIAINSADLAITGLTTKLRLRLTTATNATAPTGTWTWGLYPVTAVAGAANVQTVTLGTVITGSTIAKVTPPASTATADATSDFSLPANGIYVFGLVGPAQAAASVLGGRLVLQYRHV